MESHATDVLCQILECLQCTDLDDVASGLGLHNHHFTWLERIWSLSCLGRWLTNNLDLQQSRNVEDTWALLADLFADQFAQLSKHIGDVVLDVQNISLRFGGVKALTDISFNVREHEVRAIIGPNGAGKSSMLNCINGVYTPSEGSITFRGQTFDHMDSHQVATMGIARTFQKRVVDQHLLDFLRQLQSGELQQLNGLLQLRRQRRPAAGLVGAGAPRPGFSSAAC